MLKNFVLNIPTCLWCTMDRNHIHVYQEMFHVYSGSTAVLHVLPRLQLSIRGIR